MWLSLALFSALLSAVLRVFEKKLSIRFGNFSLGFLIKASALPYGFLLLFFFPIPGRIAALPWDFWWPLIIIWLVLYPVQTYFLYRAIREGELSQVIPVLALLPVFNIVSSFFFIGELPTPLGALAISGIVTGVYLLLTDVDPGKTNRAASSYNMPVVYMILAAVCIAIGSTLDKISILASAPIFYSVANTLGATLVLLVLTFVYREGNELRQARTILGLLAGLGLINALLFASAMTAFVYAPTSYSLAVRAGSFLFASVWGLLLLKEHLSIRKVIAFALFIAGLGLIAF